MNDTGDSILHQRLAEVQQISQFQAGELQAGEHLFLVGRVNPPDEFQFDNHLSLYNQTGSNPLVKSLSLELDGDGNLPPYPKPIFLQPASQGAS